MKKILIATTFIFSLAILSGCLTTLHPIFTAKDLEADNRLAGNWKKAKDGSITTYRKAVKEDLKNFSQTLQQSLDKIYMVNVRNGIDNPESYYYAFVVKLGRNYYLDYYPAETKETQTADAFFKAHYIPMHGIYKIDFRNDQTFELKQLDGGYLEKLIQNKQIRIQHEVMNDGDFLITASTEELQKYLIKYSDTPEAYDNDNASDYTKVN